MVVDKLRMSAEYNEWRKEILKRDNYTCQECNKYGGHDLEVHHIVPFAINKNLRLESTNGITLCKKCHSKTKTKENLYETIYIY